MLSEKQFDKLYQHYLRFFGGYQEPTILHQIVTPPDALHVDIVVFPATKERPYQVLATIGASEYAMKQAPGGLSNRNEYVTFVPADWDMNDKANHWLWVMLQSIASYPRESGMTISYGHDLDLSADMENAPDGVNMIGAVLLFPQAFPVEVLRCKTGLFSNVTILHMMPITRAEMDQQMQNPDFCTDRFYPNDEPDEALSFVCARSR